MPEVIKVEDQPVLVSAKSFPYGSFPFEDFNPVQSRLVDFLAGDSNVAIAAATSAGKTVCSEMYLSYELKVRGGKGMYISPLKALAQEKLDDWSNSPHQFSDKNISICTGDYKLTSGRKSELEDSDIIVMTSEMLSSRCRNHKSEKSNFLKEIGTIVIDESHLLTVPGRGDHLENAIMKITEINPNIRIVLLSATMPNVDEICRWISSLTNRDTYFLESDYRPCPLQIHYETYWDGERKYEDNEAEKVTSALEIVEAHPDDKFLLFVHTKRTGELLKKTLLLNNIECEFHNANLTLDKRLKLEKKFKEEKDFRVIIATSTLAWGCHKFDSLISMANGSVKKVQDVHIGDKIISLSDKGLFEEDEVEFVWDHITEESLEFTLSSGMVFEVTKDHIFYGAKGRSTVDWVEALNLKKGDYIAVPKKYSTEVERFEFDAYSYLCGYLMGDGCLVDCGTHADGNAKILLNLTIGKQDKDHIKVLIDLLEQLSGYRFAEAKLDVNNVYQLSTKARDVLSLFKDVIPIGRKGDNFGISEKFYSNRKQLRSLLIGLFDTDGGLENHKNGNWSIGFTNISKVLVKQVHEILLSFGIRSEIGKKKVKNSRIDGRICRAKRKWIWRLRIHGSNLLAFSRLIGFHLKRKRDLLDKVCRNYKKGFSLYNMPVRNLLIEHAEKNSISTHSMCESVNIDKWNSLNKQDLKEETVCKLVDKYSNPSKLNELLNKDLLWKKIVKITKKTGGLFREISVKYNKNYVCEGVVSHNCNLPARRVVILGVHRGLQEVENYDIQQMIGRAGRPAYDPKGDAYILLPESKQKEYALKLKKKTLITSQMLEDSSGQGHYKVLAFHLVSEIHSGNVKTVEDIHKWYRRTLAYFQSQQLHDDIVDRVVELLLKCKAIQEDNGVYVCTSVGVIASMFYFSPFDVADLKSNFYKVFSTNKKEDDLWVSVALANLDTYRFGIVNKAERLEMASFQSKVDRVFNRGTITDAVAKVAYAYHCILNGIDSAVFNALIQGLKVDSSRLIEVLTAVDSMAGKWGEREYIHTLQMRLTYGVRPELIELCRIPNIGKVRAEKLWSIKIRTMDDFLQYESKLPKILNMSEAKIKESVDAIRHMKLKEMMG